MDKVKNRKADSLGNTEFVRFDLATLRSATANFSASNELGRGGFGVVYKGTLQSGKEIAIKWLRRGQYLSPEAFMTESRFVARYQHINLVKHLGFCSEGKAILLVYEFLPNASLARLLFDTSKRVLINWEAWYKIILGIAKGLDYLHEGTDIRMVHYGLKTSNILLDEEMNPKIADFGMNKLFKDTQRLTNTSSSVGTDSSLGTYAYIAPEYLKLGRYTPNGDVYSFGARKLWDEDRLSELINPALSARSPETEVIRCIQVGLLCVQEDPKYRPTMGEVVLMLTDNHLIWVYMGNMLRLHWKKANNEEADGLRNGEFVRFDFATIRSATANFSLSNRLGEGRFGIVYKGTLKSGKEVAVKGIHDDIDLHADVFMIETRVVARIQHTNLVKNLGFCLERERGKKFLVYEFLPNASLASFLLDPSKRVLINWETWHKIILGIAQGLEYLHEGTDIRMVHHGLKTSNILLDAEMNPKIADFGVNQLFKDTQRLTNTNSSVGTDSSLGTYAYIAPEYLTLGRYTPNGDVYSFGVIVLETLSDLTNRKSNQSRLTYAYRVQARKLWDEDRLSELINPALSANSPETEVIRCIQVGLLCVQEDPKYRPTMGKVVLMLTRKTAIPLPSAPLADDDISL